MSLNKDDFTEEVWAEIQADIDRARLKASDTARKNAVKDAEADLELKIADAVENERKKLEMNEQEKLDAQRLEVEDARKALAADRKSLAATKKLVSAGFPEDSVDSVLPLFVNLADKDFEAAVDSFITVNQNIVKTQVDSVKQTLMGNATPPNVNNGAPVDAATQAASEIKAGNVAAGIDLLLNQGATNQ